MKILINGLSSKAGGGITVLSGVIQAINLNRNCDFNYLLISPDDKKFRGMVGESITLVPVSPLSRSRLGLAKFYFVDLPGVIKREKVDVILNLGDLILPVSVPQVYFFDWAYAVYPKGSFWGKMTIPELITRRTKAYIIKRGINRCAAVFAQNYTMKHELEKCFGVKNIVVMPTPVDYGPYRRAKANSTHDGPVKRLIYLSNYASHKNLEILIDVAKVIRSKQLPYRISLTIDSKLNSGSRRFLSAIREAGVSTSLDNLGAIAPSEVPNVLRSHHALLFPTLLESYGLPLIEAMAAEISIITSKLPQLEEVCGDAALYFDPISAEDIVEKIALCFRDETLRMRRISSGVGRLCSIPSWNDLLASFEEQFSKLGKPSLSRSVDRAC
jgi:glycosyltransferase involved in cell wall biosynthesis